MANDVKFLWNHKITDHGCFQTSNQDARDKQMSSLMFEQQFHIIELIEKLEKKNIGELEDIRKVQDQLNGNLLNVSNTLKELKDSLKNSFLTCESIQNDQQAILVNVINQCSSLQESSSRLEAAVSSCDETINSNRSFSPPSVAPRSNHQPEVPGPRMKEKILWAGSSIGRNVNLRKVEHLSNKLIRTRKAYTAVKDNNARFPNENLKNVVKKELSMSAYKVCVLATGSVEITNSNTHDLMNIDNLKDTVKRASTNIFKVAEEALKDHSNLEKVVIVDKAPRKDTNANDPYCLKSQLSEYGNSIYRELLEKSDLKGKIHIGKHDLDGLADQDIFGKSDHPKYDGLHLAGRHGRYQYTRSVCAMLQKAGIISEGFTFKKDGKVQRKISNKSSPPPQKDGNSSHTSARYQKDGNCKQPDMRRCQQDFDNRNSMIFQKQRQHGLGKTNSRGWENKKATPEPTRTQNRFEIFNQSEN